MKVPDRIYVHTGAHLGLLTLTTIPVGGPAEQEFIRKDALLELAKKAYLNENASAIRKNCFKQLIDKLNEM